MGDREIILHFNRLQNPGLHSAGSEQPMHAILSIATKIAGAITALEIGQRGVVDAEENEIIGGAEVDAFAARLHLADEPRITVACVECLGRVDDRDASAT